MSPSKNRSSRTYRKADRLGALIILACLGFAAACEEQPTEVTSDEVAPQFAPRWCSPWPSCKDDSAAEDPPPVSALVTDPASGAGVYSDQFSGAGYAVYTPEDGVTTRVDLKVLCTRELNLALPTSPAAIGILDGVSIPTCNDPGWMFLRLADLTTMGACSEGTCWPSHPSYTTNRNGKVRPTGAFAPNLHFFFSVPDDAHYDFVWTDGAVALEDLNGTEVKHVTANNAHLYRGGMNPVCAPDPAPDQVDQDLCPGGEARVDFFLPLDVKVVEGSTWPGP